MILYRLCKKKYKNDLSGKGAELSGGRWNSKGVSVLYTCESKALCTAELAVRLPLGLIPDEYYILTIKVPDNSKIVNCSLKSLPKDWKEFPHPNSTKNIGDDFIKKNKAFILKVPSAVIMGDFIYLINPFHKEFKNINIIKSELFEFDTSLFK